ncbi:MAG: extracellular solute-binding protein, partial [Anaerolineae bacterium]|nr:extracellular solute-binding protein [Anaerolineae bacterium]
DIAEDLLDTRELTEAYLQTGLLGTDDYLYYVPWMQATYIMAANKDALEYLPDGADINALTWEQFSTWCQTLMEETGTARCGMPQGGGGLFHRFLEGYMWPSFTGGMASNFQSSEAVSMMEWARDDLWPYINPSSINYDFMQEPLLAGEVWVAFDHTARLLDALNAEPENFVTFPAPAGAAGRGFMPVIVGLGIPNTAPDPEAGAKLIDYLTTPEVQGQILEQLGFFPVVSGVDTSNLPAGIALEAAAVEAQSSSSDALPALLPVGLGDRGGEINQIYRNAFDRIVLDGEDIDTVLAEEGANLQALFDETGAPCWAPDPPSEGPCTVNEAGMSAVSAAPAEEEAMAEEPAATEEAMAEEGGAAMPASDVTFFSTQFAPVEEQEVFRGILSEGGFDVTATDEGPLLDVVLAGQQAGSGEIDVIGALHGTFPPLAKEDAMMNMIDIAEDLLDSRELTEAYLQTGLLGTDDYLYYVPWMQATYIMAAHKDALEYLPDGADINALTWEQFSTWCQTLMEETGTARCGMPQGGGGLFHRFLEGYMWPSFTGGMVTQFRGEDAAAMMEWARDDLWPYINPSSIN